MTLTTMSSNEAAVPDALYHPAFPGIDVALRSGKHISSDWVEWYEFLTQQYEALSQFYARYHVDFIRAPEGFFYLRPKTTTLIARSVLSPLDMLLGKVLCLLYLSPERLAQGGIFTLDMVVEELFSLVDPLRLVKFIHPRASGSDLDRQRLLEKLRASLTRLKRMGMIFPMTALLPDGVGRGNRSDPPFKITEAVFRFAADVRADLSPREAQQALIAEGEISVEPRTEGEPEGDLESTELGDRDA